MKKKVSESRIEQVYQVRPEHLNGAGRLFGGKLMEVWAWACMIAHNLLLFVLFLICYVRGVWNTEV